MSTHPLADAEGRFSALVDDEDQRSLWPTFAEVPAGWQMAVTKGARQQLPDHAETNWSDLRQRTLHAAMTVAG
jgi:MbtH protein